MPSTSTSLNSTTRFTDYRTETAVLRWKKLKEVLGQMSSRMGSDCRVRFLRSSGLRASECDPASIATSRVAAAGGEHTAPFPRQTADFACGQGFWPVACSQKCGV